jgi:hypothetical protein
MLFRRDPVTIPTLAERINVLQKAGFVAQWLPDDRVMVSKLGVAAIAGEKRATKQPVIERAGILVGGEIAVLLSGGFQMFLETPSGRRVPATAQELKALHEFEEDVKEALGLDDLYNTSLGTTSTKHLYDRVTGRDFGKQPKPWER